MGIVMMDNVLVQAIAIPALPVSRPYWAANITVLLADGTQDMMASPTNTIARMMKE